MPETHVMLACLFLCQECGSIYSSNVEMIRGFLSNGDIPPALAKFIDKRKVEIQVQQRAEAIVAEKLKENTSGREDNTGSSQESGKEANH
jgi:hypothetical protein